MRFKTLATGLATVVLSTVLAPIAVSAPVQAQTQTSWHVNDSPTLFGPNQYWYWGDPGHGYGSNYYRYTYAIGGERSSDNWARWNMGSRVGRQEIQVYVPSNHATATVNYNITIGGNTYKRAVAQRNISGWHSLGNWNTDGSEVVIAVYDNDATQHHERDGLAASRIGVDAIRMRCVSNCGSTPPPPPPPHESTLDLVTVFVVQHVSGDPAGATAHFDFTATCGQTSSSGAGTSRPVVLHEGSRNVLGPLTQPAVDEHGSTCFGSVTISGLPSHCTSRSGASSGFQLPRGRNPDDPVIFDVVISCRETTPSSPAPPRNVNMSPYGARQLKVSWAPPADSGSAPLSHYTVRYSRPAIGDLDPWQSRLYTTRSRSHTSPHLRFGTTYTATITAVNADNRPSPAVTYRATTRARATEAPSEPRNVNVSPYGARQLKVSWAPPADSGSAPIRHYTVRYSRPGIGNVGPWTSGAATVTGTSHTSGRLRYGTTYTVTVTAVNRDDGVSGPATAIGTTRTRITTGTGTTTLGKVDNLKYEFGSHRQEYSNLYSVDSLSWEAIPGATSYDIRWEYPEAGFVSDPDDAAARCQDSRCSATFLRNPQQPSLKIQVRAKAGSRVGPWSDWKNVLSRREPRPTGEPRITGLKQIRGSNFISNNKDDVKVWWDSSRVKNAIGYTIERRYIEYPSSTHTIGGKSVSFPNYTQEPFVKVPARGFRATASPVQFADAYEERYYDNHWTLQFRIIPYNSGGQGTPSKWVSLGLVQLLDALETAEDLTCNALDRLKDGYALGSNIWGAVTLVLVVLAGGGPVALALQVARIQAEGMAVSSAFGAVKSFANCYGGQTDEMLDALGALIPPLKWFMDAIGLTKLISSIGCHYETGATITQHNVLTIDFSQCRAN